MIVKVLFYSIFRSDLKQTKESLNEIAAENEQLKIAIGKARYEHYFRYKLLQGFRVTCLFTGQYNTKGYGTITDVILAQAYPSR